MHARLPSGSARTRATPRSTSTARRSRRFDVWMETAAHSYVDETAGRGVGVTLWETEEAMANSREQAEQLRQRAAEQAQGEIESVVEYEVAVWDV